MATLEIAAVPPDSPDAKWCLEQYFAELDVRFEHGFDRQSAAADTPDLLALARLDGRPVGCGVLNFHGEWAELKRFWVSPSARGVGLGRRLLAAIEQMALEAGAATIRLDTNRVLTEAISLYKKNNYIEIGNYNSNPYAHHWFEKQLGPENT